MPYALCFEASCLLYSAITNRLEATLKSDEKNASREHCFRAFLITNGDKQLNFSYLSQLKLVKMLISASFLLESDTCIVTKQLHFDMAGIFPAGLSLVKNL